MAGISEVIGCRNGQNVIKQTTVYNNGCSEIIYSDGILDGTGWTPGACHENEYDVNIACEVDANGRLTGNKIQIITTYSLSGVPTNSYYNIVTGSVWTGDVESELVSCPDNTIYSDPQEFCDSGTSFIRWFVKDKALGDTIVSTFDTDITGAVYTVTGPVTWGACATGGVSSVSLSDIDCNTANPNVKECNSDAILTATTLINTTLQNEFDATQAILSDVLVELQEINGNTDTLETLIADTNTKLDSVITQLQTANITLSSIDTNTDELEVKLDGVITELQIVNVNILAGNVSLASIDTKLTTTNTTLSDILTEVQAINANTDQVETILNSVVTEITDLQTIVQTEFDETQVLITATNTKLDTLIAELDNEIVYTPATKFHILTTNYYSREEVVFDSETSTELSRTTQYSEDGVVWNNTAPVGTPLIGWYVAPIVTPSVYNTQEHFEVNIGNSPLTISAGGNVPHSLSYTIIEGTADVDISGNVISNLPEGFSQTYTATGVLTEDMTFTTTGRVIINIVR